MLVRDKRDKTDALIFANQNNISVVDILTSASSASLADKHFDWVGRSPSIRMWINHPDGSATMGHAFELTVDEFLYTMESKVETERGERGERGSY